jgi:hypothetical protein
MSVIWNFYFKIKEGIENVDNYVMPISFSNNKSTNPSRDESKTIHIPEQVTSAGDLNLMKNTNLEGALNVKSNADIQGPLLVKGTTTLEGNVVQEIKIPKDVPIHFGIGESKQGDAGKISYGSYDLNDTLSIVGGGNGARKVKVWDQLNVGDDLNVGKYLNVGKNLNVGDDLKVNKTITTNNLKVEGDLYVKSVKSDLNVPGLKINNTANLKGIQSGTRSNNKGKVYFSPPFENNNVFVFCSRIQEEDGVMSNIVTHGITNSEFSYTQTGARQGSDYGYDYGYSGYEFKWIAFCIG